MHGQDDSYGHDGGEGDEGYDYEDQHGGDGQGMGGDMSGMEGGQDGDMASLVQLVVKLVMDPQPGPSHVPKPQHAHSRFAQDPHHAESMQLLDKIACGFKPLTGGNIIAEPIHEAHLESMVHVGLLLLARLAKKVGMTAGHEAQDMGGVPGQGQGLNGGGQGGHDGHDGHDGLGGHGGHEDEDGGHDEDEDC
ncbi:hypothetical protein AYO20_06296 [Fonsecaea nubica]|uniref:Uncharacterized protein n=1 Tax=Fonsecaea nubica TaxID=856822 RepID=A0A178CZ95_9EURO|nr:hypothetical protein AYO20_06296 [Fonsecaea nubica]OAL34453.1 hypothetical protein AYO20_06296 [Fonsecaea nubica]